MWEIIEHCLKMCSMFVAVCSENDLVILCTYICVAGESADSDQTLHRGSDAVPPISSHYADVSRAWDIMDIMNNMEVVFEL